MNIGPFDASFWADPYRFYPLLLTGPPLRLPLLIPTVVVARYRDVVEVLGDAQRFSSRVPQLEFIPGLDPFAGATTVLLTDPPDHTRLRRLLSRYFGLRTIEALRVRIRATTDALLDRIAAAREFDAVRDFGAPLPTAINAYVLGIPIADEPMLRGWSDEIFAAVRGMLAMAGDATSPSACPTSDVVDAIPASNAHAIAALRDYFRRVVAHREADAGPDLVSALIPALHAGELTRDELLAILLLVLFAGADTTMNLITNGLLALVNHPHERARLGSDPTLIVSAVDEILRYDSPVQMVLRYSTTDTAVGGTDIPAGAAVAVLLGAANRDPAQFTEPDRFDAGRRPNAHVAYGAGIHACVAGQLARIQGQIAIGGMLERFPALRLRDPEAPLRYAGSLLSRGLASLPMVAS